MVPHTFSNYGLEPEPAESAADTQVIHISGAMVLRIGHATGDALLADGEARTPHRYRSVPERFGVVDPLPGDVGRMPNADDRRTSRFRRSIAMVHLHAAGHHTGFTVDSSPLLTRFVTSGLALFFVVLAR